MSLIKAKNESNNKSNNKADNKSVLVRNEISNSEPKIIKQKKQTSIILQKLDKSNN